MPNPRIGVIGTGSFAEYFISALRNGGYDGEIFLSPFSPSKAEAIAGAHRCVVCGDENTMLESSDWVLLAVRPEHARAALDKLVLRPGQVLLSAVAGLSIRELQSAAPAGNVTFVRIMPSSYIGVLRGSLFPIFPPLPEVEIVLAAAGKVVALHEEGQLELSMIGACLAGWMYRFISAQEEWFTRSGLTQSQAREIVAGNILGAAGNALLRRDISLEQVSDEIATEGTFTKLGLDHLLANDAFSPWQRALDVVLARLGEATADNSSATNHL